MGFENGHLVRVVLRAVNNNDGDEQVNVLHYDLIDAPITSANDPQTLADRFRDDVIPHFKNMFKNTWTIQPVVVEDERDPLNPTGARSAWVSGAAVAGSRLGGEEAPRAMCVVVTLRTAHIGRRFTGRMFVSGENTDGDFSGNNWNDSKVSNVDDFVAAIPHTPDIAEGVSDSTARWCVYSRTQRGANDNPYANAITSYQIRRPVHWLRSRALG